MKIRAVGIGATSASTRKPNRARSEAVERGKPGKYRGVPDMAEISGRIDAMRDELVNHRADGYATTTDVLRLLELIEDLMREERTS